MSEHSVDESWQDELLSAYVDGELTSTERAQVEQRLRQDPAARQLVAEFEQLTADLQALPTEQARQDLRTRVLEQVANRGGGHSCVNREQPPRATQQGNHAASKSAVACVDETLHWSGTRPRLWLWPCLALAATLLLAIYLPDTVPEAPRLAQRAEGLRQGPLELHAPAGAQAEDRGAARAAAPQAALAVDRAVEAGDPRPQVATTLVGPNALSNPQPLQADYSLQLTCTQVEQFPQLLQQQGLEFDWVDREEGLAEKQTAAIRQSGAPSANQRSAVLQILVQGSPQQLQRLMATCRADPVTYPSLRLATGTPPSWYRQDRAAEPLEGSATAPAQPNLASSPLRVLFYVQAASR